jgi:hypothetical protein
MVVFKNYNGFTVDILQLLSVFSIMMNDLNEIIFLLDFR